MPLVAQASALLAGAIHVWFFVLESVLFGRPGVAARFGLRTAEQIAAVRPMAFNQGFYNLFLAIGVAAGIAQIAAGEEAVGRALVLFCCACMVGAGIILFATSRRFLQASIVQALPPLVAILATLLIR
jgi:putative membrane protein